MGEEEKKAGRTPEDERREGKKEDEGTQSVPQGTPHGSGLPGPVVTKEEHEEEVESREGE